VRRGNDLDSRLLEVTFCTPLWRKRHYAVNATLTIETSTEEELKRWKL